jgi:hypothetical protein
MPGFLGREVRNDLMAVEIEVHPLRRTAAFRAAEQLAVKRAGCREAVDGKRQMERRQNSFGSAHDDLDRDVEHD